MEHHAYKQFLPLGSLSFPPFLPPSPLGLANAHDHTTYLLAILSHSFRSFLFLICTYARRLILNSPLSLLQWTCQPLHHQQHLISFCFNSWGLTNFTCIQPKPVSLVTAERFLPIGRGRKKADFQWSGWTWRLLWHKEKFVINNLTCPSWCRAQGTS